MIASEHDQGLLSQASNLHYTQWYVALDLAEQANSPEVRDYLEGLGHRLHHTEEYYAGML